MLDSFAGNNVATDEHLIAKEQSPTSSLSLKTTWKLPK